MSEQLKKLHEQLLRTVQGLDGIVNADAINEAGKLVIGVSFEDDEMAFIEIQPA